jgi:SAM-dependent methyltransferase
MRHYYSGGLSAERLRACYDVAPKRTQQYLDAEISHVLDKTSQEMRVLELGCGYGRVLKRLSSKTSNLFGVDTSLASLKLACEYLSAEPAVCLAAMNAVSIGFSSQSFDLTLCIQNGISAFHIDQVALFREAVRVTRKGGLLLFSSSAPEFWPHRIEWFEGQVTYGLIGPIDYGATGNGVIVCKDGFHATTVDAAAFISLAEVAFQGAKIVEVDNSSVFCEITVQ